MPRSLTTFLMFEGVAEEAMNLYVSTFDGTLGTITRWAEGEPGKTGTIKRAEFTVAGRSLTASDSAVKHAFGFTPAMSLFVDCTDVAELERVWAKLEDGGKVLMPLGSYGFSTRFGWLNDRFGVSWQLNVA